MIQKVVVFDTSAGGGMFADYLESELSIVDVVRVLDYRARSASDPAEDLCALAETALLPFIGRAKIIVLASYEVTLATWNFLHHKYPKQKFVGFWPQLAYRLRKMPTEKRVMLLASNGVRQSRWYQDELKQLERFGIVEADSSRWLAVDPDLRKQFARRERRETGEVDVVLLYNTELHCQRDFFEEAYGWQVKVLDDFQGVFRDVCAALGLRGKDGGRALS